PETSDSRFGSTTDLTRELGQFDPVDLPVPVAEVSKRACHEAAGEGLRGHGASSPGEDARSARHLTLRPAPSFGGTAVRRPDRAAGKTRRHLDGADSQSGA